MAINLESRRLGRRSFLKWTLIVGALPIVAACQPQVVEKVVTQIVEKEKIVEKPVEKIVEKQVEKVVTQIVEKEKIVVATPVAKPLVKIQVNNLIEPPNPHYLDAAKLFNQAYGGRIQVELLTATGRDWKTNLITAIQAGSPPDTDVRLQIGWLGEFGAAGWLLGLDKYLAEADFAKDIPKEVLVEGRLKPTEPVIIIPAEGFTSIMYYNKAILDKAGVKPPATIQEFKDAVKAIAQPQNNLWGYGLRGGPNANQHWEAWLFAHGGDWFDPNNEKILLDQEPAIQAAQMYIDFYKNKWVRPESLTDDFAKIAQGLISKSMAMWNHGIHVRKQMFDGLGKDLGYIAVPKGTRAGTWKNFNGPGILKASKNPDAAFEYIKWFMQPEWRKKFTVEAPDERIPTTKALMEHPKMKEDEAFKLSMSALFDSYGRSPNWHPKYGEVIGAEFHVGLQKALLGEITAKQWMERARDVLLGKMKPGA